MARGPYYTDEQDKALLALFDDNPGMQYRELGELAVKYNVAPSHEAKNIGEHISRLVRSRETSLDAEDALLDAEDALDEMKDARHKAFVDAIFKGVEFKMIEGRPRPWLDFPSVINALYTYEPNRMNALFENFESIQE